MANVNRPHAIVLAFPSQGHIKPMMHFSKILSARGFYITFVNTEFIQAKMTQSGSGNSMADFRFETLPDGLPPNHGRTAQVDELCKSISDNWPPLFEELIDKLHKLSDVPPLTCIVYNSHLSWAQKTATRLGIPGICFWTASACGFNIFFSGPLLMEKGYIPLKDKSYLTNGYLEEELSCIPGMPLLRRKDVPSMLYDATNYMFHFLQTHTQSAMSADFLVINTFDELEGPVMEALRARLPVYTYSIGPLLLSATATPSAEETPPLSNMISASIFSEEKNCVQWLDDQKPGSVVYVCFGSMVVISDRELVELAWGLEASKELFLWAIRPDLVNGASAVLPTEFVDKVKGRGFFVSWAPQVEVLSHPSVGGFLTHNGWNSTLESICSGLPMISWPSSHGEQQINRTYVSQIWKIGIAMNDVVERGGVEEMVKRLMRGKEGEEMRKRIGELRAASITAVSKGGSSYNHLEKILVEIDRKIKI